MSNKHLLIILLAFFTVTFSFSQNSKEYDFGAENMVFSGMLGNQDEGILLAALNTANKNLSLTLLDKNLKQLWKVEINNRDYGYFDPTTNSKSLDIYLENGEAYVLHPSLKNSYYLIKISKSGEVLKSVFNVKDKMSYLTPYIKNSKLNILLLEKLSVYEKRYVSAVIDPNDLSCNYLTYPEIDPLPGTPFFEKGKLIWQFLNGAKKGTNEISSTNVELDLEKNVLDGAPIKINFSSRIFPAPDIEKGYGTPSYYTYYSGPYAHFYHSSDNRYKGFFYGMSASESNLQEKNGFYFVIIDSTWKEKVKREFLFEDLSSQYPIFSDMSGKKVYETYFFYDSREDLFYYGFKNFEKKKGAVVTAVINQKGDIVKVYQSNESLLHGTHRYSLSLSGNSDFHPALSIFKKREELEDKNKLASCYYSIQDKVYLIEYLNKEIIKFSSIK